jgi:succinate dehydrogenase hydrophobic anchor subunit
MQTNYRYPPRQRTGLLSILAQAVTAVAITAALGYVLLLWAQGCGEHYIDSTGKTQVIDCK